MAEKMELKSSDKDSNLREEVEKQQQTILLELKMILETVKSIDGNIVKSIELLQEPTPTNFHNSSNKDQTELNYNDIMKRNIDTVTDILKMLDSL